MIAVTFALASESRDFRRLLADQNHEVAIFHTGVGERVSRERLAPFLQSQRFDFLISAGFAGGLDESLGVGDLVLAENFSEPALLSRARELLIARVAKLATADQVVATEAERKNFAREKAAVAVDMETACIAQACAARGLPLLSLRAISDTARAPLPAPPAVLFNLARQKTEPLVLLKYLALHPSGIVRLLRFARQVGRARLSLTNALAVLVHELRWRASST